MQKSIANYEIRQNDGSPQRKIVETGWTYSGTEPAGATTSVPARTAPTPQPVAASQPPAAPIPSPSHAQTTNAESSAARLSRPPSGQAPPGQRSLANDSAASAQSSQEGPSIIALRAGIIASSISPPLSPIRMNSPAPRIQEAYSQFLKQKYSYAGGASSVICSISQSLVSAQSDKSDDEDSVKRANHSVTETGWTYRLSPLRP